MYNSGMLAPVLCMLGCDPRSVLTGGQDILAPLNKETWAPDRNLNELGQA